MHTHLIKAGRPTAASLRARLAQPGVSLRRRGFTLLELLVVLNHCVAGGRAEAVRRSWQGAQQNRRLADESVLDRYRLDTGYFPRAPKLASPR